MWRSLTGGRKRRSQPCAYVIGSFAATMLVGWLLFGGSKKVTESESRLLAARVFPGVEDVRPPECSGVYRPRGEELEQVSVVVFAFLNDDSVVSQTIASIIANTPSDLLKEILVALPSQADKGRAQQLSFEAETYGSLVRLLTWETIAKNDLKSKFLISHVARASIVAMMNDDVVVGVDWLVPLIVELKQRPQSIVLPHFDNYDKQTKAAKKVDIPHRWIFDWDFAVKPYEVGYQELAMRNSEADVLVTPAFSGHAFAAYKRHLETISGYKHDVNFAGGLEVSFLNWLCGDGVRIVPCSRMARAGALRPSRPLEREAADYVARRYLDAASLAVYERVNGESKANGAQLRLEEGLKSMSTCKSFSWYMKEVARDVFVPDENVVAYGVLGTVKGPTCFKRTAQMTLAAAPGCDIGYSNQVVSLNKKGQLHLGDDCIKIEQNYALADVCIESDASQFWKLEANKQLKQMSDDRRCLAHMTDPAEESAGRQVVMLSDCLGERDGYLPWQLWTRLHELRS